MLVCNTILSVLGQPAPTPPATDLGDARLKADAGLAQNDRPGVPLAQMLAGARASAPAHGIDWKGLQISSSDDVGVSPHESMRDGVARILREQSCRADAIVEGRPVGREYHLSASGTSVYGDYLLAVERVVKDYGAAALGGRIVVTRPGGSLTLADGPVRLEPGDFPLLRDEGTYLMFLRYVRDSGAFRPVDGVSTLTLEEPGWRVYRKVFAGVVLPGSAKGEMEATIGGWVEACR